MKFLRILLGVLLVSLLCPALHAASTEVNLVLAADTARPGDTVLAGIQLHMKPHWHTYWRNPGGSGQATSVAWDLPPGITAGEIQWPVPEKLPAEELTTYIYSNDVVLLVPLKIAADVQPGTLDLKAKVKWLECDTQCVLGRGDVQTSLTIGNELKSSTNATVLTNWQAKLPVSKRDLSVLARWEKPATNDVRSLLFEWPALSDSTDADFYPYSNDKFDVQLKAETVSTTSGRITVRKFIKKLEGGFPDKIAGLLIQKSGDATVAYEVDVPIADVQTAAPASSIAADNASAVPVIPHQSFWLYLLYAFAGGLILNVMPCVLPVIALKILGFVNQSKHAPGQVRKLGLIYALGVLVSFLVLAGLVIGVKQAGHQAGWGMQFGNPQFIVVMTVLITLVALNLFGLFEINLGGKVMGAAGDLSAKEGSAGAFFNGVLATILATPCTAPFLGVALGFAFGQSYVTIILIFLTVGLGLAAPYVILSWNPALLKLLPKPGAWMEKFKVAMGFPMLATAVWLFDLTTVHYGRRILWLGLFLVLVALAAWIYGEFVQRGRGRKSLALAVVLAIFFGGYAYAIEGQLRWRFPIVDSSTAVVRKNDPGSIDWQPWSPAALVNARAAGHPVLVDFTADWCQVCQINRQTSIEIQRVKDKLKAINAVALEGDYTKLPDSITTELNRFGRAGVPLVLVYPADVSAPPQILPDGYLTPGLVLSALDNSVRKSSASASSR